MRRLALFIAPVFLVLAFAGCGDDDEEQLSEDDYVEQANAVCEDGNAEISEMADELPSDPEAEDLEPFLDDFVANLRGQFDDIEDLAGPSDLDDEVDAILDDAREIVDDLEDQGPESLFAEDDPFEEINDRLVDAGLTTCGS